MFIQKPEEKYELLKLLRAEDVAQDWSTCIACMRSWIPCPALQKLRKERKKKRISEKMNMMRFTNRI